MLYRSEKFGKELLILHKSCQTCQYQFRDLLPLSHNHRSIVYRIEIPRLATIVWVRVLDFGYRNTLFIYIVIKLQENYSCWCWNGPLIEQERDNYIDHGLHFGHKTILCASYVFISYHLENYKTFNLFGWLMTCCINVSVSDIVATIMNAQEKMK